MAHGGPVTAGTPYIVGEHRPELFVPKVDGMILPRVPSFTPTTAPGSNATTNITIPLSITGLPMQAESPADIVREIRRATSLGLAPRKRTLTFAR